MTSTMQIIAGSFLLFICSAIHLVMLVATIRMMRNVGSRFTSLVQDNTPGPDNHWGLLTAIAFAAVVAAHTIQVWLWAAAFVGLGALTEFSHALYFSLVTYTTLGYGDVTVSESYRLFAAMAAVTGLLNFGLSTAFLVGLMARLLPSKVND